MHDLPLLVPVDVKETGGKKKKSKKGGGDDESAIVATSGAGSAPAPGLSLRLELAGHRSEVRAMALSSDAGIVMDWFSTFHGPK